MLLDHIAAFLPGSFLGMNESLFMLGDKAITLKLIFHYIGRTAFPIFAFLITEGYTHTHDRKKYGISLLMFALISEIPWNLARSGEILFGRQNVFFTLFLGYVGICILERYREDIKKCSTLLAALFLISIVLRADYGCFGFGFIMLIHLLKNRKVLMSIIGTCVLPSRWIGGTAFIPILLYNGKRGFAKGKFAKYAFYAFYPVHLLLLYLLRVFLLSH